MPPFPTELERLVDGVVPLLGQSQSYAFSDEVDVEWQRQITLFIEFSSDNGGTVLALLPEVFDERAKEWFPLHILGTAINPITDPVGAVSQAIFAWQIITGTIGAGDTFRVTMSFDVSAYRKFRLGYAEVGQTSSGPDTMLVIDVSTNQ